MTEPNPSSRIVTFYSYKGGTGRSMALANIAWLLALSGRKVLVMDWDLEAPGLHRYFGPFFDDPQLSRSKGLIDFAVDFVEAASEQDPEAPEKDWYKQHSNVLRYAKELDYPFPGEGTVDFLPAGLQDEGYPGKVNTFNWRHFYDKLGGWPVLEEARRLMREAYDIILVDSRTGVSDTAGICTVQMPDDLVVCFTLNLQSIYGASGVAADVIDQRVRRCQPVRVLPVPMRVEAGEKLKVESMKAFAKPRFLKLLPSDWTEKEKDTYWSETQVPYIPFYAFDEILAYFLDDPDEPTSVLNAMRRIAARIIGTDLGELPKLDEAARAEVLAKYDAFAGRKPRAATTPKSIVFVSRRADQSTVLLEKQLELAGLEILSVPPSTEPLAARESLRDALKRASLMLLPVAESGLERHQRSELLFAGRIREANAGAGSPIYTVLLSSARPEALPRLLLPYPVLDLRAEGDAGPAVKRLLDPELPPRTTRLPLCPYPGLRPFTGDDAPVFCGRDAVRSKVADAVGQSRLVALIGPPYSGKTSLVRAALIPYFQERDWRVFDLPADPWQLGVDKSSAKILAVLDLGSAWPSATQLANLMQWSGLSSGSAAAAAGSSQARPSTPPGPFAVAAPFTILIVADRPDSVPVCEHALGMTASRFEMPAMTGQELGVAVAEPASRAGLVVDESLPGRIAADFAEAPDQLPVLQFILERLWRHDPPEQGLTLAAYAAAGGPKAIEVFCESIIATLKPELRAAALRALGRTVAIGTDGSASIRPASAGSLETQDREAIVALTGAGISAQNSEPPGAETFNFSHPIFFQHWPRLQQYWRDNREFLVWREALDNDLAGRAVMLLNENQRAAAERWMRERRADLNTREIDFLKKSLEASEKDLAQKYREQRQRRLSLGLGAGVVVAIVAGLYSWNAMSSSRFKAEYFQALFQAGRGDVTGAIAAYERLHAARPGEAEVSLDLARLQASTGNTVKALDAVNEAIKVNPADGSLYLLRGDIAAQQGQAAQAQADYQLAAKYNPGDSQSRMLQFGQRKPGQIAVIAYQTDQEKASWTGLSDALSKAGFWPQRRQSLSNVPPGNLLYSPEVPESRLKLVREILGQRVAGVRQANDIGPLNIVLGY